MVVQSAVKYYGSCAVSHFDCYIVISCFRIDVKSFYEIEGVLLSTDSLLDHALSASSFSSPEELLLIERLGMP